MDFLIEWVTNIILFVLLATVIDMLMPNSAMQKYTKIVTGLLLIAIILSPILKLISSDFEEALASLPALQASSYGENSKSLLESQKKEIQEAQHAYILEQMAVQLEADTKEELMNQFGYQIKGITVAADNVDGQGLPEQIDLVSLRLAEPEEEVHSVRAIEVVNIRTTEPLPERIADEQTEEIRAFLADKWQVPAEKIVIAIEGGVSKGGQ
ncbi:stage III sporulation protein AF [Bacillus sp. FJAT-27225]|uniref:stage III sporulation protein AF n=1 Tax=Bacillus sp. FJAT-27225 TaxID=1743144 RepID=UPI00080C3354|nr:stage III sporulation protein AF [Bacillus sp. FJAT-27225]OCA91054.1 stage III sporulation protein AF [Bacillus sp. FJAT-27225]